MGLLACALSVAMRQRPVEGVEGGGCLLLTYAAGGLPLSLLDHFSRMVGGLLHPCCSGTTLAPPACLPQGPQDGQGQVSGGCKQQVSWTLAVPGTLDRHAIMGMGLCVHVCV